MAARRGGTVVGVGRPVTPASGVRARRVSGGAGSELHAMNGGINVAADTTALTAASLKTADLPSTFV